jgi:hypothetical protein
LTDEEHVLWPCYASVGKGGRAERWQAVLVHMHVYGQPSAAPPCYIYYTLYIHRIKQDNATTGNTGSTCALDAGHGGRCQTEFGFTPEKITRIGMSQSDMQTYA